MFTRCKGKKLIFFIAIAGISLAISFAFSSLAAQEKGEAGEKTTTVVDSAGRYVEVPKPLERIVALNTDAAEVLRLLGAEDKVIGVADTIPKYPRLFPKMSKKPVVGGWREINYEKIAEVGTQVVISYLKWPDPKELEDKLKPFGIEVIHLDFYKTESLDRELRTLALALGKEDKANEFISWSHKYKDLVKSQVKKVKPEDRVQVYMEMSGRKWKALGPGSGADEVLKMAGGKNICEELHVTYPEVDPEWILEKNPELIIKTAYTWKGEMTAEEIKEIREEIISRIAIKETTAAKERKVYIVNTEILGGGPRSVIGVCYLGKILYPKLFEDIDVEKIHKGYWEKFMNLPYQGIHLYPQFE